MKLTRRKTILGMGLLAGGSGATLSSAAFQNSVNPGADFRVVAAAQTVVRRGPAFKDGEDSQLDAWAQDEFLNFDELGPNDLPAAGANGDENGNLDVSMARGNSSNEIVFENFLEIDNAGTTTVSVGLTYATGTGPGEIGYTEPDEDWYNDTENEIYDADDDDSINRHDIIQMFQFNIPGARLGELANESGGSNALISPNPETASGWEDGDDEEPDQFVTLGPGESISVDLVTDLTGEQVSTLAEEVGGVGNGGTNPFEGETAGFEILDSVFVGTEAE